MKILQVLQPPTLGPRKSYKKNTTDGVLLGGPWDPGPTNSGVREGLVRGPFIKMKKMMISLASWVGDTPQSITHYYPSSHNRQSENRCISNSIVSFHLGLFFHFRDQGYFQTVERLFSEIPGPPKHVEKNLFWWRCFRSWLKDGT